MRYCLFLIFSLKALSLDLKLNSVEYLPYTVLAISHLDQENYKFKSLEKVNAQLTLVGMKERKVILENSLKEKILNNDIILQKRMNITTAFIKRVEKKLKEDQVIYSKFSLRIISDLIKDYKPYFKSAFLNRYQSYSRNNSEEVKMYRELRSIIKLSSNILHEFMKISAKDFNKKISRVIEQGLILASEKAQFFYFFTENKKTNDTFLIIKRANNEKKLIQKETLKGAIQNLDSDLMESASKEVDKLDI